MISKHLIFSIAVINEDVFNILHIQYSSFYKRFSSGTYNINNPGLSPANTRKIFSNHTIDPHSIYVIRHSPTIVELHVYRGVHLRSIRKAISRKKVCPVRARKRILRSRHKQDVFYA